ncbi:hypothetical protein [Dactylosporangium matsuzakiense]|uniref:Uncharacterized protein n=1 Tax=Dactylosporangium matsuzakiense TaxID=53360 RepID=A0A9W6KU09_9ACTN|nr:hypothetical protein [Dactylosporangium matsuzakiense]UWZ48200.1 hypothetical protein Dmats_18415 [Dactylosporangium matsuzakiense]GLL08086.1 hypothetical protein GCM10017581_098460 [Dactylosporangium matsuzakiense]
MAPWLGFLADEARPPTGIVALSWVESLLSRPPDDEGLYVAANLIALAVFRAGEADLARHISHEEIGYALRREARDPVYLLYALQPQINLLRLDGYGPDPDRALRGLDALARLAAGLDLELPALSISAAQVRRLDEAGLPVRKAARDAHIIDTCKLLWRLGRPDRLVEAADGLLARYPEAAGGGPHHAAEALWLAAPESQAPPPTAALDSGPRPAVHLAFLRLIHHTARLADLGETEPVVGLATRLLTRQDILGGPYASALTPLRWRAALADSLLRVGRADLAEPVLRAAHHNAFGDPQLARGTAERLGMAAHVPPVDRDAAVALAHRVLDRLSR